MLIDVYSSPLRISMSHHVRLTIVQNVCRMPDACASARMCVCARLHGRTMRYEWSTECDVYMYVCMVSHASAQMFPQPPPQLLPIFCLFFSLCASGSASHCKLRLSGIQDCASFCVAMSLQSVFLFLLHSTVLLRGSKALCQPLMIS